MNQQQQQTPYVDQGYQQTGMYGAGPVQGGQYIPLNPAQNNAPPTSGTPGLPPIATPVNYQNFQTGPPNQMQNQYVQPQQPVQPPIEQARVATPKAKLPLPEEYMYLQTVFEELKNQCINAAGNPVSFIK